MGLVPLEALINLLRGKASFLPLWHVTKSHKDFFHLHRGLEPYRSESLAAEWLRR